MNVEMIGQVSLGDVWFVVSQLFVQLQNDHGPGGVMIFAIVGFAFAPLVIAVLRRLLAQPAPRKTSTKAEVDVDYRQLREIRMREAQAV